MEKLKSALKRLLQYALQGALVLAPVAITGWVLVYLFTLLDKIIPIYFQTSEKEQFYIPGIGFLMVLGILIIVGYFSSFFVVSRILSVFDHLLERTPGIKVVYTLVKDFSEAFAGKKRKFKHPVLVSIYNDDVYQLGFITNQELPGFELDEYISVYIPSSYAVAGTTFLVNRSRVKPLKGVTATDAMKFAISGGVAHHADE